MTRVISAALLLTNLILIPFAPADAKLLHRRYHATMARFDDVRPPLTVNRRSFLDPGPVVPAGSMTNYMAASTTFNGTPDPINNRSAFGIENLPAPFEVPGRPSPVLEWYAPRID